MKKKILFMDLDGTLLDNQKKITTKNKEMIDKATALGHSVVITTGRPLASTKLLVNELGLTTPGCYAIASNGGQVYDCYKETLLVQHGISKDCVPEAFRIAKEFGIYIQTYLGDDVLAIEDGDELQHYAKKTSLPYKIVPTVEHVLTEDPIKLLAISLTDRPKIEAFRKLMEPFVKEHNIDMFFSCPEFLEFLPKGINKGSGVQFLVDYLQLSMDDTISVGDEENDISMLSVTKEACVMKNAAPEMYSYATYVTTCDNDHSGVAEVIEKFMLNA